MIPAWRLGKSWRFLKSEIMKHFEKEMPRGEESKLAYMFLLCCTKNNGFMVKPSGSVVFLTRKEEPVVDEPAWR
jgi:hypothetical protein